MDSVTPFGRFWHAYPKRVGRKKAEIELAKALQKTDIETILAALAWQCELPQWTKDDGEYVPMPQTYLHQERWTDEPPRTTTTRISAKTTQNFRVIYDERPSDPRRVDGNGHGLSGDDRFAAIEAISPVAGRRPS